MKNRRDGLHAAAVLAALHLSLALALQLRVGVAGVVLWYVGPSLLAAVSAVLLLLALVSAIRRKETWSRQRVASLAALGALAVTPALYRTYPSSHDAQPSETRFVLPLDGPVTVAWGGENGEVNAHVFAPDQRWAYDLIVTRNGRSFDTNRRALADYFIYGKTVHAPASGLVIAAHDAEPDMPIGEKGKGDDLGNHVALQVAPGEYLFIAHMQPGSVAVRVGDRVSEGQTLGRVGNSGISSEPHVHMHLQDSPRRHIAEAVPFYFADYCAGATYVRKGMPTGGREGRRWLGEVLRSGECAEMSVRSLLQPPGVESHPAGLP